MIALTIEVRNAQKQSVDVGVANAPTQEVNVKQDTIIVPVYKDAPLYEGEYEVTPKVTEQVIPTKDKLLKEDMIVNSIPFFNVSNTSGGKTVYIGNEV